MQAKKKAAKNLKKRRLNNNNCYSTFSKIDGSHPLRDAVPDGYVDYPARLRKGGSVAFFNFELAKEMGLIPKNHPHSMNNDLEKSILKTFGITIINEYDVINEVNIPEKEVTGNVYMATRYLQLQHPNKRGETSGDGRSIWNGHFKGRDGVTWDVSSCGTGATCLSPATARAKKFFKTGDKNVSYGCGYADLSDGISGAILSEIFHKNGIRTERTLAVIRFENDLSVNVRAAKNLFRPSHLFLHLKQDNLQALKGAVDYYIKRQMDNGEFPKGLTGGQKYNHLLKVMTRTFAEISALFESNYIFCWLDWDGDNILSDGGIIDYGSVRQFGMYHDEYRYDDVERMSTTIPEQKEKAKYIVQTYAQIVDFLKNGKKKGIDKFRKDACLKDFEKIYVETKEKLLLEKIGFNDIQIKKLMRGNRPLIQDFQKVFTFFEREKTVRGQKKVLDGITRDAIFCMRDILRELPRILKLNIGDIGPADFIEIISSKYATKKDLKLTPYRIEQVKRFQCLYKKLIASAAKSDAQIPQVLLEVMMRSSLINKPDRVTGDSIIHVANQILKKKNIMTYKEMNDVINGFIQHQILSPDYHDGNDLFESDEAKKRSKTSEELLRNLFHIVDECREGI